MLQALRTIAASLVTPACVLSAWGVPSSTTCATAALAWPAARPPPPQPQPQPPQVRFTIAHHTLMLHHSHAARVRRHDESGHVQCQAADVPVDPVADALCRLPDGELFVPSAIVLYFVTASGAAITTTALTGCPAVAQQAACTGSCIWVGGTCQNRPCSLINTPYLCAQNATCHAVGDPSTSDFICFDPSLLLIRRCLT